MLGPTVLRWSPKSTGSPKLAERLCAPLGPEPDGAPMRCADDRPVTEHVTDRRFSTHRILREEQDLQTWAETNTRHIPLNSDARRDAAEAIAGHAPLVVLVGPAGTGKTRTTATAVAELQELSRPVIGLAPSGKAADVLLCRRSPGLFGLTRSPGSSPVTDTAARSGLRAPRSSSTRAGMTATADLAQLVHLVRVNRWRLVAVGDPEQLPSVARGGVFAHWCNTVAHHTLDTPRQFSEPWETTASLGLRRTPAAVQLYTDHRRLHTAHPALVAGQVLRTNTTPHRAGPSRSPPTPPRPPQRSTRRSNTSPAGRAAPG